MNQFAEFYNVSLIVKGAHLFSRTDIAPIYFRRIYNFLAYKEAILFYEKHFNNEEYEIDSVELVLKKF